MNTLQEEFIADMEKTTRGTLLYYVDTWDLYMHLWGIGAVSEEDLDQGIRDLASDIENKLQNLGFNRTEALILMAKAITNKAELQNLYQVQEAL